MVHVYYLMYQYPSLAINTYLLVQWAIPSSQILMAFPKDMNKLLAIIIQLETQKKKINCQFLWLASPFTELHTTELSNACVDHISF